MRNIASMICAAAVALTSASTLPVAAIATIAVVAPDSASAWHRRDSIAPPRKVNLACVQQKMSQGSSYDQALNACWS